MSYSVVIPTMGRDTLDRAIQSAATQSYPPSEILVVAGRPPHISEENIKKVRVIDNYSDASAKSTVARNRNIGVSAATSDFVSFLDDDDTWMPEKMKIQMEFLAENPRTISVTSAKYLLYRFLKFKRPKRLLSNNESVLAAHYGKRHFLPSPYYTSTCGTALSRNLAQDTPFNEDLPFCEDIWWLHELQSKGVTIHQHPEALFQVTGNLFRAAARDSGVGQNLWESKLRDVNPEFASNYLRGISFRSAILRGNIIKAFTYLR